MRAASRPKSAGTPLPTSGRGLAQVEEGGAKAEAVLAMTNACEKIGRGADAIPWLQEVLPQMPGHAPVGWRG